MTAETYQARYVACDPRDGRHLRDATPREISEYWTLNGHADRRSPFDRNVRVGDVVIVRWTGPGASHAGAGF